MRLTRKDMLWLVVTVCIAGPALVWFGSLISTRPDAYWSQVLNYSGTLAQQFEAMPQRLVTDDHDSRG